LFCVFEGVFRGTNTVHKVYDMAAVRQEKTGHTVRFEMTEQTREAVDSYSEAANEKRASSSSPAIAGAIDI
jgi:hypothetical protein